MKTYKTLTLNLSNGISAIYTFETPKVEIKKENNEFIIYWSQRVKEEIWIS